MSLLNKYLIKRFDNSQLPAYFELYKNCFSKPVTLDKVRTTFFGLESIIGHIAYFNDLPVAFYGVLPVDFRFKTKLIKGAQSVSSMVHPKFRKDMLYLELANLTEISARQMDVLFFFGWPNEPRLLSGILGWQYLSPMMQFSFSIKTLPLGKVAWKFPFFKQPYHGYLGLLNKMYGFPATSAPVFLSGDNNECSIPRSNNYITYKKAMGSKEINVKGKSLWIGYDYRLKIGDIEECTVTELEDIIHVLRYFAVAGGLSEITMVVSKDSYWYSVLRQLQTPTQGLQTMYHPLIPGFSLENVYFTWGDYDTF